MNELQATFFVIGFALSIVGLLAFWMALGSARMHCTWWWEVFVGCACGLMGAEILRAALHFARWAWRLQ